MSNNCNCKKCNETKESCQSLECDETESCKSESCEQDSCCEPNRPVVVYSYNNKNEDFSVDCSITDLKEITKDNPKRGDKCVEKKCCESSEDSTCASECSMSCDNNKPKTKRFCVTFGPKKGHPWEKYNCGSESCWVNSKNGPSLKLKRGNNYIFEVEQNDNHEIVLTDSPKGGECLVPLKNIEIVNSTDDSFCFTANKKLPIIFFYQCKMHECEGGVVYVFD